MSTSFTTYRARIYGGKGIYQQDIDTILSKINECLIELNKVEQEVEYISFHWADFMKDNPRHSDHVDRIVNQAGHLQPMFFELSAQDVHQVLSERFTPLRDEKLAKFLARFCAGQVGYSDVSEAIFFSVFTGQELAVTT